MTKRQEEAAKTKAKVLGYITQGYTVEEAMRAVGKSVKLWEYYRSTDKEFKENADKTRADHVARPRQRAGVPQGGVRPDRRAIGAVAGGVHAPQSPLRRVGGAGATGRRRRRRGGRFAW